MPNHSRAPRVAGPSVLASLPPLRYAVDPDGRTVRETATSRVMFVAENRREAARVRWDLEMEAERCGPSWSSPSSVLQTPSRDEP